MQQKIKEIIVDRLFLDIDTAEIEDSVDLEEYGIDSFLKMELMVALEEEFDIKFPKGLIQPGTLSTVNNIIDTINKAKQAQ